MARVAPSTSWFWVRHAPAINPGGGMYGNQDVPCDCSDLAAFDWLARILPTPDVLVTSQLCRTHQTAEGISEARQRAGAAALPGRLEDPELAEQNFGSWQGMTYDQVRALNPEQAHDFWLSPAERTPPEGESFAALAERVARSVDRLNQEHAGKTILAVTHGGTIRAAIGQALALPPEKMLSFSIANLSVTRIDHFETPEGADPAEIPPAWRVASVNVAPDV